MSIDNQFVNYISPQLDQFKKKNKGTYNFRCPYCGDSQKYKNKARGYFFTSKNDLVYKCHNCGVGRSFSNFLKEKFPLVHDRYVMEKYKSGLTGKHRNVPKPEFHFDKPTFKRTVNLEPISSLNKSHLAMEYAVGRGLPADKLDLLYYCPNFKEWTNTLKRTFNDTKNDEPRIIIPLNNREGSLIGFQGRALSPAKMRYITIMLEENAPKVFGLDRINESEPIYIVEGPFDSLFLDNSIAMAGSDLDPRSFGWGNYIYVYDNEPRNTEIINRISNAIDRGDKVVIWPKSIDDKDINDMYNNGIDVKTVVHDNVYQGLEAKLQLSNWKV
tara:strand:+ start:170 stop:1153 length:984 start_codon:yes stop_codon:yes gene_type:complete